VKANVLFFDKKPASETPWTQKLWIYDLRTNMHFTLKTNSLQRSDLDEFVKCYNPDDRHHRKATWKASPSPHPSPRKGEGGGNEGRWRSYNYNELVSRDKASLDIFWLKDESLEASDNLPDPDVIAQEIVEDLEAALEQFREIVSDLAGNQTAQSRVGQPEKPIGFVVRGLVRAADGSSLSGLTVRAFDRDLRNEELLGETMTDKNGRYEITYSAAQFPRAERKSADLVVRAYGKKKILAESRVVFNAKSEETVDVVVSGTS